VFERFTDRARRVVVLAQEEARGLNHEYLGTEHLLLGLVDDADSIGSRALVSLGIGLDSVRAWILEALGPGPEPPPGYLPLTPRAKRVLGLSLAEAQGLGRDGVGTGHLLLGLVHEGEGVAAQVLAGLGADLERLRGQVADLSAQAPRDDDPGAAPATAG
jgi:ATP-dependent Clp protease ATP-binding subunit ClpC